MLIRGAALCAAAGVALSITDSGDLGKWLTGIGVLSMIVALHRFGRSGPDEPIGFQLAPRRKKKKKKDPPPVAPAAPAAPEPSTLASTAEPTPPDGESSDGL